MVTQKPASAPWFSKNQPAHPRSVKTSQHIMVAQKPASTPWFTKNQPPHPGSSKTSHHAQVTTDRKITKLPFTFFSNPLGVNRTLPTRISTSRGPIFIYFFAPSRLGGNREAKSLFFYLFRFYQNRNHHQSMQ